MLFKYRFNNFNLLKRTAFLAVSVFLLAASPVSAYQIEKISDTQAKGDYAIGPGKTELLVDPGQQLKKELIVTNRLGRAMSFKVEVEDFAGTRDPNVAVNLLGNQVGPYSLKDFLQPEVSEFVLQQGERIVLPITISIPTSATPGGLYGAVIVSTNPGAIKGGADETAAQSQVRTISRLASLFFVRVNGPVKEDGSLKEFTANQQYYEHGPINFRLLSENNGSVHLNPYGLITVTNMLGRKVGEVEIDPFFVLPNSLKSREVSWQRPLLFGRYQAKISLNRGYQNIVDEKTIAFWVIPYKIILAIILVVGLICWLFVWLAKNFEFRRR